MAEHDTETIATITKGRHEEIRIGFGEFKGRTIFHARIWYLDDADKWQPGKGIGFRADLLPEFAEAVSMARSYGHARGMCK